MERRAPQPTATSSPLPLAGGVGGGPVDKAYARPTARARQLRAGSTEAERILWHRLSGRQAIGARFNRQVPIGPFVCDFVCRAVKLVVEVDGGHHAAQIEEDARRTRYLEANGYCVIRFWNNDVLENVDGVVEAIADALRNSLSPNPSRRREGSRAAPLTDDLPSRLREGPGEGLYTHDQRDR